jgi:hypothetical protein
MLRNQRLRRAVASFFDATGTALDCLAAVLIVVTRAPFAVQEVVPSVVELRDGGPGVMVRRWRA